MIALKQNSTNISSGGQVELCHQGHRLVGWFFRRLFQSVHHSPSDYFRQQLVGDATAVWLCCVHYIIIIMNTPRYLHHFAIPQYSN